MLTQYTVSTPSALGKCLGSKKIGKYGQAPLTQDTMVYRRSGNFRR
jgi:hypothetical protein